MQERERARLQKMGTSSLQADSRLQSRKARSFNLPSFRRSSARERQEVARSEQDMARIAEQAARIQKAAAWQWYTRGVGEAVAPTKRPPVGKSPPSQAPIDVKSVVGGSNKASANNSNVLRKKPLEPSRAESLRVPSRFNAEARPKSDGAQPTPSAAPPTPLYDEFELSGLRTQMADYVQRLQSHQQTKDIIEQFPGQQTSEPLHIEVHGRPLPAAASVSTDHQHIKAPHAAAAAISSDHQLTRPTPTAAPFHTRPFSALRKLFRKVVSGSIIKSTKDSPLIINSSPAGFINEPEVLSEEEEENPQYHYHHYIHHHHYHYHYGESPEGRRRHSESSNIRPHITSPWEAESMEAEEEAERRSPFEGYLARRRRHSDTYAARLTPKKAAFDQEEEMKEESAKAESPLQLPRRYNSERFSPKAMDSEGLVQPTGGGTDEEFLGINTRRRSVESNRKAVEGGKSGGGMYKLTGAGDGASTPAKPLVRRRRSEGLPRPEGVQEEMGKCTPLPSRPNWQSPSASYLEDVLERQIGAAAIAAAAAARVRRPRAPVTKYCIAP